MEPLLPITKPQESAMRNDLLATSMSNETLASRLRGLATTYPMGSLEFHILLESAERMKSYS